MDETTEATRELVLKKVEQMFPQSQVETVIDALDSYGVETYEQESARVQLAILKLSAGRLDRLSSAVTSAKSDWRDVLAWAEYPRQISISAARYNAKTAAQKQEIRDKDRQQYLDWLNDDSQKF